MCLCFVKKKIINKLSSNRNKPFSTAAGRCSIAQCVQVKYRKRSFSVVHLVKRLI